MYIIKLKYLLIYLILLNFGCALFNQPVNPNNVLAKVCQLMDKPIPSTFPTIWVVDSSNKLADICTRVDKNSLRHLTNQNVLVGACIAGDIFLLKSTLSEFTMAHEMAHYMGANEKEAERVAANFSYPLVFWPMPPNGDWGRFAINRNR